MDMVTGFITNIEFLFLFSFLQKPGATFVSSVGSSTSISTHTRSMLLFTHQWVSLFSHCLQQYYV